MDFAKVLVALLLLAAPLSSLELALGQEIEEGDTPEPFFESRESEVTPLPAETGFASFYHSILHGQRTANGERFDRYALTAAHRTLPFGTLVRVTNLRNQRSVIVRINDRGPLNKRRVIDVSPRAARELGFFSHGLSWVMVEVIAAESQDTLARRSAVPWSVRGGRGGGLSCAVFLRRCHLLLRVKGRASSRMTATRLVAPDVRRRGAAAR